MTNKMITYSPVQISIHILLFGLVSLPILIFNKFVWPYRRGFYCDDESIRYPFKESTVSMTVLNLIIFPVPILTICLVEMYRVMKFEPATLSRPAEKVEVLFGYKLHPIFSRLYYYCGFFLLGAAATQTITDIGKYSIGRLRPHFLAICQPDIDLNSCSGHTYIENFSCTNYDDWLSKDARLSFPSGHSSLVAYGMLFIVMYLQIRVQWDMYNRLIKPFIQFIFICLAIAIGLSRISNYKHHWSDVLCGLALGFFTASLLVIHVMQMGKEEIWHFGVTDDKSTTGIEAVKDPVNLQSIQTNTNIDASRDV
ncbi:Lipid phosphate phosphohydrolase 1 [Trichinella pseudospiralis]|uniref:Lipid phosphate phosphohydrolase 1 n=3 Tax=Trichinella pseudospiralis TaxID=6337 RepID=A0A0V1K8G8_TRIPS|nr:Lipid phosphate phosphohydrolase 1 [Trichinella pseudospiralis]